MATSYHQLDGKNTPEVESFPLNLIDYETMREQHSPFTDDFQDHSNTSYVKNDSKSYLFSNLGSRKGASRERPHALVEEIQPDDTSSTVKLHGHALAHPATDAVRVTSWAVMIVCPLLFIALGICAVKLENKSVFSDSGIRIQEAAVVATSIWPIAFAAIVAQSLRAYASYKAEGGIQLMALEQFISSYSVASALRVPFQTRRVNLMAVCLVVLWALSPLASQALQRMLPFGPLGTISSANVTYLDTFVNPSAFNGALYFNAHINDLYGTLLISPPATYLQPSDIFGNPRIPTIATLPTSASGDGWYKVGSLQTEDYYSLLGTPIEKPLQGVNGTEYTANFITRHAFFSLSCFPIQNATQAMLNSTTQNRTGIFNSYQSFGLHLATISATDFTITLISRYMPATDDGRYEITNCTGSRIFIESQTSCDYSNCSINAIRTINNDSSSLPSNDGDFRQHLSSALYDLVQTDPPNDSGGYTSTQLFLTNGPANRTLKASLQKPLSSVDTIVLSFRFARLLNSYWQAAMAPSSLTGSLDLNDTSFNRSTATATVIAQDLVFQPSKPWLAILFVCSFILLFAGIGCVYWDMRRLGPDMFVLTNLLLTNSKYTKLPEEKGDVGIMSRAERARLLAECEVMVQDVEPESEVGMIALNTKDRAYRGEESRLKRGRLYR